jgi:hypothetical protein
MIEHGHIASVSPFAMPFICRTRELFEKYTMAFAGAGIEIRPMIAGNMQLQPFYKKYVAASYPLSKYGFPSPVRLLLWELSGALARRSRYFNELSPTLMNSTTWMRPRGERWLEHRPQ